MTNRGVTRFASVGDLEWLARFSPMGESDNGAHFILVGVFVPMIRLVLVGDFSL